MIDKTLAILAGGKSSRMNYNNKALLKYNKITFIEHIIKAGSKYKEIIIISNNKKEYEKFNVDIFEDIYKEKGPLSGIHSALVNSKTEKVLCVACDMPLIGEELLNLLGSYDENYDVLVPKVGGRLQPLCSIYSKVSIDKIENALKRNENKLRNIILKLNHKIIDNIDGIKFLESGFINVNTPDDYKKVLNQSF